MSSSDSEDDSFLNPTQKLDAMINNYNEDADCKINDYLPPDIPTCSPTKNNSKNKSPAKAKRKRSTDSCSSDSIDLESFRSAFPPLNDAKPKQKRVTRSTARKNSAQNSPNLAELQKSCPKRKKQRGGTELAGNASETIDTIEPPTPPARGKGRGRARGRWRNSANASRNRRSGGSSVPTILEMLQAMIPVFSVGNTDEYTDQSDNQQLFSNKKPDDVVEIEDLNETLEENELMSVKVEWMSASIYKFDLRKYQKLTPIFEHFSTEEKVSYDKLYFSYNGKIIKPDDTPDSIDYSIAKFIDGGIVSQSVSHLTANVKEKDGVKLKFQCQNVKKPFEIIIKPDDKMATAMLRCAEHYEKPLDKLRFEFDGDIITGKSTPRELELEDGGCIDVKVLN